MKYQYYRQKLSFFMQKTPLFCFKIYLNPSLYLCILSLLTNIFTCFREIYGLNLVFVNYLFLGGLIVLDKNLSNKIVVILARCRKFCPTKFCQIRYIWGVIFRILRYIYIHFVLHVFDRSLIKTLVKCMAFKYSLSLMSGNKVAAKFEQP